MKSITLDTAEESVLLVVKGIGGVKNGLFDVERLSHTTDYEFNEMSLSDVRRFAVEEDFFLKTIYDSSHPHSDSIQLDASLDGSD